MAATRVINLKDAVPYFSANGEFSKQLRAAAMRGIMSTVMRAKRDIVSKVIPAEPRVPVDRGIFKAAWQTERLPNGGAIYNNAPHANFIEYGVPAGNVVMSNKAHKNIAEWAARKFGGLDAKKAWEVAGQILFFMKSRGIFKRGKGLRILEKYSEREIPRILKTEVEAQIAKAFP